MATHGTAVYGKNRAATHHQKLVVIAQLATTFCNLALGKTKCREACHVGKCPVHGDHEKCVSTTKPTN